MAEISEIGFIQKINKIYPKIDTIVESGELFSDEVVETLNRLENKDLSFVISDLRKDTYLGNRKIDIDIALNKKGIEELTDFNEIMNIWTNVQTTVYYSSINVIFIDGQSIQINFVNEDGDSTLESSHGGILDQLSQNTAFQDKLINTIIREEIGGKTGSFIRIVDVDGKASNLRSIEFIVSKGDAVSNNIVSFWAKTTSSLQAITNIVEHLTVLLPHLLEISLLSQNTTQIKNIGNAIVELLNINTHLSKLINIDSNMDELVFLSSETNSVKVVANDIAAIKRIDQNINKLVTIYDNIVSIGIVSSDIEAVKTIRNNITALQVIYSNINALKNIGQNISNLVNLEANLTTLNPLLAQIDNVVLIAQNIATVLRAGQNVETIENYKNEALASQAQNEILNQQIEANTQTVNEKTEIVLLKTEEAKNYAQQASNSESQSLLYKEAALIASQQSLNSAQLSEQSSNTSIANADRAESVLSTISSVALIPLWEESTDLINKDYTKGTQVIDPFDVEIYVSKNDVIDSRIAPSIDSANWKRLLGVNFNIDGGYANTLDFTQTLDGGTANG